MHQKIKKCFYEKLTFKKMMEAHKRARKHKGYRNEVIRFEMDLENNITNLINRIKNKKYKIGEYRTFVIYEPKERTIKSLPYVDRVVHQWYVEEFIKPYILPSFISTSYACLENKGTHNAVAKIQEYMRIFKRNQGDFWILKCDIRKFFYSIDPVILFEIMKKYIRDKELLNFTKLLIFNGEYNGEVGIPIGNYTSQFFANIYMNELDQYVKRVLKVKYYARYMDDFVMLVKTKQEAIELKKNIAIFIEEKLHLKLNDKSRYYPDKMGLNFCGYRIFTTHRLLRTNSKKKIKRNVKKWNKLYKKGTLDLSKAMQSINSWLGHSSHCNSYKLQQKVLNSCEFLINPNSDLKIEQNLITDMYNY